MSDNCYHGNSYQTTDLNYYPPSSSNIPKTGFHRVHDIFHKNILEKICKYSFILVVSIVKNQQQQQQKTIKENIQVISGKDKKR